MKHTIMLVFNGTPDYRALSTHLLSYRLFGEVHYEAQYSAPCYANGAVYWAPLTSALCPQK